SNVYHRLHPDADCVSLQKPRPILEENAHEYTGSQCLYRLRWGQLTLSLRVYCQHAQDVGSILVVREWPVASDLARCSSASWLRTAVITRYIGYPKWYSRTVSSTALLRSVSIRRGSHSRMHTVRAVAIEYSGELR